MIDHSPCLVVLSISLHYMRLCMYIYIFSELQLNPVFEAYWTYNLCRQLISSWCHNCSETQEPRWAHLHQYPYHERHRAALWHRAPEEASSVSKWPSRSSRTIPTSARKLSPCRTLSWICQLFPIVVRCHDEPGRR